MSLAVFVSLVKVVAVLTILVFGLRFVAKHQGTRSSRVQKPLIEVVEQVRLGRSANIAAVRVGDRILLVGATESSIETLAEISDDVDLRVETGVGPAQEGLLSHAVELLRSGAVRQ